MKKSNELNVENMVGAGFPLRKVTMTENINKIVEALTFWQHADSV